MRWLGNVGNNNEIVLAMHVFDVPCNSNIEHKHSIIMADQVTSLTVEGILGVGTVVHCHDDDAGRLTEAGSSPSRVSERV